MLQEVSPYLLAGAVAWLIAQGLKYLILSIKGRTFKHYKQLYLSGSMPSAHSATVVALVTVIGFRDGPMSAIFGLAVLLAAIVMYDAVMVRRSSGEQGAALTALLVETKSAVPKPRVAKGHTPMEVLAGIVVGVLVGIVVILATS
jgi:acid phosphatase family membrane protein YuiD